MEESYRRVVYETQSISLVYAYGIYREKEDSIPFHYDSALAVSLFRRGAATLKVEGVQYELYEGDVFLIDPGELHRCVLVPDAYYERLTVYIKDAFMQGVAEKPILLAPFEARRHGYGNRVPLDAVKKERIDALIGEIEGQIKEKEPLSALLAECKTIELLAALGRLIAPCTQVEEGAGVKNEKVREIIRYIGEHYSEELSCEQIAARFYLSRYHLSRLFKEWVGMPLWDYVILRRIFAFNELLNTDISTEDAAYAVGFHNYSNFFRLYKRHMSVSPQEYRKKIKNIS